MPVKCQLNWNTTLNSTTLYICNIHKPICILYKKKKKSYNDFNILFLKKMFCTQLVNLINEEVFIVNTMNSSLETMWYCIHTFL